MLDIQTLQLLKKCIALWFAQQTNTDCHPWDLFAEAIHMGPRTFRRRINGQKPWQFDELVRIVHTLRSEEFARRVQLQFKIDASTS